MVFKARLLSANQQTTVYMYVIVVVVVFVTQIVKNCISIQSVEQYMKQSKTGKMQS